MFLRLWRGSAVGTNADAYQRHVTGSVFPTLKDIPGHRGACLLRREAGGAVEFMAVTAWDDLDAIRAFAGDDPDVAVVEPAAHAVLSEHDSFVRNFEVVHGTVRLDP